MNTKSLAIVRHSVCAVGYIKVPLQEYVTAPEETSLYVVGTGFLRNSRGGCGVLDEREAEVPRATLDMLDDALSIALLVVRGSGVDVAHAKAEGVVEEIASFRAVAVTALALPVRAARRR